MYFLYSCLSSVALIAVSPWLTWQAWRHGKYAHSFRERLGRLPASVNPHGLPSLWIHAVSVGEVLAVRALLPGLRASYPDLPVLVSTTTRTGREIASTQLEGIDGLFYVPLDFAFAVRRVLRQVKPRLVVIVETEIWPRLLRECHRRGVPTVLINARISDRSFPRYRAARALLRPVLAHFSRVCAQSARSAERLLAMGASASQVVVTGSLKFDALDWTLEERGAHHPALRYFTGVATRPVLLAASTLRGEDTLVLDSFTQVRARHPRAVLLLVPRHPERFDEVTALAGDRGFTVTRRTTLVADAPLDADVVIVDTMGELAALFALATVVFVGGSLVNAGGHNILEPALFGKAIIVGPSMHNFPEIAALFLEADALRQVQDGAGLTRAALDLFDNPEHRATLGGRARALLDAHRGAAARTLEQIHRVLAPVEAGLAGAGGRAAARAERSR